MTKASAIIDLVHHDSCPLCGGDAADAITDTHDLHYGIAGSWKYQRCSDCRVLFLNPAPSPSFLSASYDDSYYSYQSFKLPPRWQIWLRRLICYELERTGDPDFARSGRVLDIGCGSGKFLFRMQMAGWETAGVELSARAAEIGNRAHQLNIQSGTVHSAELSAGHFDYIRFNHSFEHLLDPRETLQRIRPLLAKDGMLFIGVPNVDSLAARWFGKHWWNLGPPVHPFNYCRKTLTRLLTEQGYEVVRYRTNSTFAGLLGSLQMRLNDHWGLRSDTGKLFSNPVAKIFAHWMAKLTDLVSAGDCLEIIARRREA